MRSDVEFCLRSDRIDRRQRSRMGKQIFILSGQSNMSGRGGVLHRRWDGVVPPACCPNPSVLRFAAASLWEEARDPLHADIDAAKVCGVGPGMAFANALLPRLPADAVIGLVPCAIGGTPIREWERGCHLYEKMVRRAREAAEGSGGGGGEIKAVLWYQGESDTSSRDAAEAYGAKMESLIRDLRSDLQLPSLPFIQVAIASGDKPYIDVVREAQLQLNLPNVVCVDAMGLPLNSDHLHLSTEAQVLLGEMLAETYVKHYLS
ncbi:probable carbohydrate esterase At4g34215 [Zingiber officinale]|uniref:probable carbohydrate esterase At4g34215 n=1 Tax=Zingiber officinale TaxID=94328 RepID=UPI001C4CFF58|nr:probable carbohydrate esterase At4g34215 [Zingiber officinale]